MRLARSPARDLLSRPWRPGAEAGFIALVVVAWQLLRIPLEGSSAVSLAHARSELRLERALHVDIERALIHAIDRPHLAEAMGWFYENAHLPVLVGFLMLARLAAPQRYPRLRMTFALSYVPAAFVIGLYPLAPPRWVPELGGTTPTDAQLTGTTAELLHNSTAAAASHHFGIALFVAAGALWLWPSSPLARLAALYPVAVFLVILGTGNHYVLDCVVGAAAIGIGAVLARWLVTPTAAIGVEAVPGAAAVAVGWALLAWSLESIRGLVSPSGAGIALALVAGLLLAFGSPQSLRPAPATRS
jgi:PAP2 superfamily protein